MSLTIHQKINLKSYFPTRPISGYERASRPYIISNFTNWKREISAPFWNETFLKSPNKKLIFDNKK